MKKHLSTIAYILTLVAVLVAGIIYSERGKKLYIKFYHRDLREGLQLMLLNPFKYRYKGEIPQQINGKGFPYNYIEQKSGAKFNAVRNFILSQYEGRKDFDYKVKIIATYRSKHEWGDASNPDLFHAPIFWIKETKNNKNLVVKKLSKEEVDRLIFRPQSVITRQSDLVQDLDKYFNVKITWLSIKFIFLSCILGIIGNILKE